MLASLEAVSRMSEAGWRLYQLCAAFIRVTRAVVSKSHQQSFPSFGFYDDLDGSLKFLAFDDGVGYNIADYCNDAMTNTEKVLGQNVELDNASAFLGSWLGENTASNGIFNLEFGSL